VEISISNAKGDKYDFSWLIDDWSPGEFKGQVYIQLELREDTNGDEQILLYMDHTEFFDLNGYNLLVRNSSTSMQYLPLKVDVEKQLYIDPGSKALAKSAGTGVLVTMLITIAVNVFISVLSSGSMALMWTLLNTL